MYFNPVSRSVAFLHHLAVAANIRVMALGEGRDAGADELVDDLRLWGASVFAPVGERVVRPVQTLRRPATATPSVTDHTHP